LQEETLLLRTGRLTTFSLRCCRSFCLPWRLYADLLRWPTRYRSASLKIQPVNSGPCARGQSAGFAREFAISYRCSPGTRQPPSPNAALRTRSPCAAAPPCLLGLLQLTLPKTPPARPGAGAALRSSCADALGFSRSAYFLIFFLASILTGIRWRSISHANQFLTELKVANATGKQPGRCLKCSFMRWPSRVSWGASESSYAPRGMLAWAVRYVLLHSAMAGSLFLSVERHCPAREFATISSSYRDRSTAIQGRICSQERCQCLITLATYGLGMCRILRGSWAHRLVRSAGGH